MDAITTGVTVSYVLSYNQRHPERPLLNGATFGDFEKIHDLVKRAGLGQLPEIGHGVKRLSESTGETDYAYHVKGLEIAAYQPETNPGYCWAIAGGHMSMGTYGMLAREGKTDLDSWVAAITRDKLQIVGFDMIGLCKFFDIVNGIGTDMVVDCLAAEHGLKVTREELQAAVKRAFLRGLALEMRQGYGKEEYCLPAEVTANPNRNITLPVLTTPEFLAELEKRVWEIFDREMQELI